MTETSRKEAPLKKMHPFYIVAIRQLGIILDKLAVYKQVDGINSTVIRAIHNTVFDLSSGQPSTPQNCIDAVNKKILFD
jgi:hypothetical protein